MSEERFTSFIEYDGYWIRDESDFKIIATGLKLGVALNLRAYLNELNDENKELKLQLEAANLIKDLKCGLGEMKPYYCKGDYIWSDENGNIISKSRQEFEKSDGDAYHYDRWIKEIKKYVDNEDFEYNEEFIIKLCLSYTLQSLRNGEDLKRFQWGMINDE